MSAQETGSDVMAFDEGTPTEPDLTAGKKDVFLVDVNYNPFLVALTSHLLFWYILTPYLLFWHILTPCCFWHILTLFLHVYIPCGLLFEHVLNHSLLVLCVNPLSCFVL